MVESVARLVGLALLLGLLLAPLTLPTASESYGGGIPVIYFRDYVIYDSSGLNACGVNYVVKPNLKLMDLIVSKGAKLREPSLVATAVEALRSSIEDALKRGNVTGRVFTGSMPIGRGRIPFAIVSVPESSDVASLSRLLGQAASRVGALINANVTVVLQVVPDELFKPVNLSELRRAIKIVESALVEAIEVASGKKEPGSREVAVLAEALKRLSGGNETLIMRIEWPEPEFGDPLYVSIDLTVMSASITKEAVEDVVKAIRGIIGCDYPLVLGLADFPLVQPDVLIVNASDVPTITKPATGSSTSATKVPAEPEPSMVDSKAGDKQLVASLTAVVLIFVATATWILKRYKAREA